MEQKTKIQAEEGKQDLYITREFDLPIELLFKAFTEAEYIEQWMSNPYSTTRLIYLENRKHGSYEYESTDPKGFKYGFHGTIHDLITDKKITRTFEMENTPMGVQLEIYEFEKTSEDSSKLKMHVIYESANQREQVLKMPFAQGINMAHDRLQDIMNKIQIQAN